MPNYQFRQKRPISQTASRSLDLREQEMQMREEVAYGRQELESYKTARAAKQQELKIIQDLRKEKQIAAATAQVGKLDPLSPTWLKDYSAIMAAHPYAHADKPLTDIFHEQAKINNAYLSAQIHKEATDYTSKVRRGDEEFKADLDVKKDKKVRGQAETEQTHKELIAKAIKDGVDINKFTTFDENGEPTNTKWAELAQSASTAQSSVPTPGVIERHAKVSGVLAGAQKTFNDLDAKRKAALAKNPKAVFPEAENAAYMNTKEDVTRNQEEMNALQGAYPGLAKKQATPAAPTQQLAAPVSPPSATTESTSTQATPKPSPTPFDITDLFPK